MKLRTERLNDIRWKMDDCNFELRRQGDSKISLGYIVTNEANKIIKKGEHNAI